MERPIAIVEAPSVLGLRPSGVERLPEALLGAGLAESLDARRAGVVHSAAYDGRRDEATKLLNPDGIAAYTLDLADAVGRVLDAGEFPLVLGGDCSILLGALLALRRSGRYGLLFLDGHADFYQPEANVNGEAASSELALATGRGPDRLTRLGGAGPLVQDEDVVVFGYRDAAEAAEYGSQPLPQEILAVDLGRAREGGIRTTMAGALDRLARPGLDGFWLHFDADVLDDQIMPAVDYRLPDGLSWSEAREAMRYAAASGRVAGIDVTIFNPTLDADGSLARTLAELIVATIEALPPS